MEKRKNQKLLVLILLISCLVLVSTLTCAEGQYQSAGILCLDCSSGCKQCSSSSVCQSCKDRYMLYSSSCVACGDGCLNCQLYQTKASRILYRSEGSRILVTSPQTDCILCQDGYYQQGSVCIVCQKPCLTCNSKQCTTCVDSVNQIIPSCQCQQSYFMDTSTYMCLPCAENCLICTSLDTCQTCAGQNQSLNTNFQCVCDDKYTLIEQNCEQCISPCVTCFQSVSYCTSCVNSLQVVNDGSCVCQIGYFLNIYSQCQVCSFPCKSCENTSDQCLTCIDVNQIVDLFSQCICKQGFYQDQVLQSCVPCNKTCSNCNQNNCLQCLDTTLVLQSGSSSCICPKGYFLNDTKCLSCQLPCSQCIDQFDKCLECADPNSTLIDYSCICNSGYGVQDTTLQFCIPCAYPCLECSNDISKCTNCSKISLIYLENSECRCPQGYFIQDFECIRCSNQCKECLQYADHCLNCIDISYEFMNNGCFCPYGYYIDNALKCSICKEPCMTCQYNYDFCISCVDPLSELINNSCLCSVKSVYLLEYNKLNLSVGCHLCNEIYFNCEVCDLSFCQQCQQGYNFNENQECLNSICGDTIKVDIEQCDDGNNNEFDGCFQCLCELGWIPNELSCQSICGDQIIVSGEQCDDGNEIQYDGCYQCKYDCNELCIECIEGRCIKCKEGFILEENQCIVTCGDGILNILTEQCDDHNNIPRDGCNNCIQEDGFICYYQNQFLFQSCERCSDYNCLQCSIQNQKQICQKCIEGYYIDSFQSCSKCDKICIDCIISPKNCINFDSSLYQLKYCNQQLGFYYDYETKDCVSKCGDGIISGQEQCDDLNTNDFDGCNNKCQIESGYLFDLNTLSFINEPTIEVQSHSSSNDEYSIFAEQFQDTINCTGTTMNIELFNQSEYNYTIIEQGQNCNVSMQFYKTVEPLNLIHILIKFKNHLSKRILDESPTKEIIIVPKRQVYANEDQKEQGKSMAAVSKSISSSIVIFAPLALIVGGFKFIWAILDIMSWMNNFYYLNVQYPENVRLIFQQAEWSNIINFPQLNIFNKPSDEYYFKAQIKFTEKDVDPLFINNIQIVIVFIFQVLITQLICILIRKVIQTLFKKNISVKKPNSKIFQLTSNITNDCNKEHEIIESKVNNQVAIYEIPNKLKSIYFSCINCEKSFVGNLLKTLQISYLDILLAIVLQITNQQTAYNSIVKINIILAIVSIGIVLLLIHLSYQISIQHHLKLENQYFSRRYSCFYENVKTNSKISMIYSFVNMLRKTIFIATTVLLYDFPIYQTSVCFFSCFLNIILLIHCNPFNNRQQYILNFIPDFCICIIVCITIIFAFQDQFQILKDDNIYILGWIIGASIYLSILLQLMFLIKELIQSVWKKIKELFIFLKSKFSS